MVIEVTVSEPEAVVSWLRNGKAVRANDVYEIEANGLVRQLIVKCVDWDDAAKYTCDMGEESTPPCTVKVIKLMP